MTVYRLIAEKSTYKKAKKYVPERLRHVSVKVTADTYLHVNENWTDYPMEPSISNLIKRFISTAYSIGSSFVNGSIKPITII
ncbi:hypothetical protein D3C81_1132930 [compost metagenome]